MKPHSLSFVCHPCFYRFPFELILKLAEIFNNSDTKYLVAFKLKPNDMMNLFNVKHIFTVNDLSLEKGDAESYGSEYHTHCHLYERREKDYSNRKNEESIIESNFKRIVDIKFGIKLNDWIKLSTENNKIISIEDDLDKDAQNHGTPFLNEVVNRLKDPNYIYTSKVQEDDLTIIRALMNDKGTPTSLCSPRL